ncbi:lipocalin family protein [Aliiglaciecola sp. M165]|uniref:lipocalin family protein n=1 Tax=Aliiglaciecola sp. M165 TaxID=2593649 RepID=UPI00117F6621|nr:lipocalin family protein [Aliiglaciecola sp. M165]TRY33716.1 lipocalin [Aliiglaciecola sp. M165]
MKKALFIAAFILLQACTSIPDGIKPVDNFELDRYLGTWYEIARLDHKFERGLDHVTAHYEMREDGGVSVTNRGYNAEENEWEQADGKAYFVGDPQTGHLKVSFFGPFYVSYVIFDLDSEGYQYALVTGPNRDYFWILSRQKQLPQAILNALVEKAKTNGFATEELIYVSHP